MTQRKLFTILLICAVAAVAVVAYGQQTQKAKDPVCGLEVEKNPSLSYTYKGETYYFCLNKDLETFKKSPEEYVGKKK